jgi:hypothetical protein
MVEQQEGIYIPAPALILTYRDHNAKVIAAISGLA